MPPRSAAPAGNFGFLSDHDPLLLRLCVGAERNYHDDPNTTVIKLRQFGEAVVRHLAAVFDITAYAEQSQAELLKTLQIRRLIDRNIADLLHFLRKEGNLAAHQFETTPAQAKSALKIARELALWFHRSFGKEDAKSFKAGAFQEPVVVDLQTRLAEMSSALNLKVAEARAAYDVAKTERQRRVDAESKANANAEERALWEQLAQEEEQERLRLTSAFETRLAAIQVQATQRTAAEASTIAAAIAGASQAITLDEMETRAIIDAQLIAAGWLADSEALRFGKGTRAAAGKCQAIAEWPTGQGPADYVLFSGLTPLAIVEAKRYGSDVSGVITQAERYSEHHQIQADEKLPQPPGVPQPFPGWFHGQDQNGTQHYYRIPFVYATNGRPFLQQLQTKSGIWFRDVRQASHHARALLGWHSPDALKKLLEADTARSEEKLQVEPFSYLSLRDY